MIQHESCPAFKIADLGKVGLNREVKAEVVFGTPSKHCAGAGICMVSISNAKTDRIITCPVVPVWISSANPHWAQFRFEKAALQTEISKARFSGQEFVIEEAFRLPLRLTRQLGLVSYWGQPGIYPVVEREFDWVIRFPVGQMGFLP